MARVFISYKRADKEIVFPLRDKIKAAIGEDCWIDLDGIESDAQFVNVIIHAIDAADIFLFMYSHNHELITDFENDWTIREINYAQEEKKRIVFVNIDNAHWLKWFKFMFPRKQQIDATNPEAFEKLLKDLQKWLGITLPKPEPEPKPKPKPQPKPKRKTKPAPEPKDEKEMERLLAEAMKALDEKEYIRAMSILDTLSKAGHPQAQFLMGKLYAEGLGVAKDEERAAQYLSEAAMRGYPDAFAWSWKGFYLKDSALKITGKYGNKLDNHCLSSDEPMIQMTKLETIDENPKVLLSNPRYQLVHTIGLWDLMVSVDLEVHRHKDEEIIVYYYIYPKETKQAEIKTLMKQAGEEYWTDEKPGFWKLHIPYEGVKWPTLPDRYTGGFYLFDIENGKRRNYHLKVVAKSLKTQTIVAELDDDFMVRYDNSLFSRSYRIIGK